MADGGDKTHQDQINNKIFNWLLTEISCSRQEMESKRNLKIFWLGITITAALAAYQLESGRIIPIVLALYSASMFIESLVREKRAIKINVQLHNYLRDPRFEIFTADKEKGELPNSIYEISMKHVRLESEYTQELWNDFKQKSLRNN
jgi:hypothetical protein